MGTDREGSAATAASASTVRGWVLRAGRPLARCLVMAIIVQMAASAVLVGPAAAPAAGLETGLLPIPVGPIGPLPPMPGPLPAPPAAPPDDGTPDPIDPPTEVDPIGPIVIAHDRALVREAQAHLIDLGMDGLGTRIPAIDGWDGVHLRGALCAFRGIALGTSARGPLTDVDLELLRATAVLPLAHEGRGVVIDRTCQLALYHEDGAWRRIMPTSTGRNGQPYVGEYRVQWKRPGWHTSTLYPARRPNMYNTVYFAGPVALHGSTDVPRRPASAGCARLELDDADFLFERLERGDRVRVVGSWSG
jgi:hypothetical protein